ncbi:MAG TPA: hypothetical protein DCO86_02065, partial [Spirochaetaceae bacterium]|nr:hypothetical protein [Spirochaetaceae bacterium]
MGEAREKSRNSMKLSRALLFGIVSAALLFVAAALFVSCSKKKEQVREIVGEVDLEKVSHKVKNDLVIATAQDINQLNPLLQNDQINQNCLALTHTALLSANHDTMEIIPMLAQSWRWFDQKHLELSLDRRAKFSTGDPVTADDVVFTLERAMSHDPSISLWSGVLSNVEKVEATGKYTVVITLRNVDNDFLYTLNARGLSVQSRKAYDDPDNKEPWLIGSGRYKFKEWKRGERVVFERVENYWGDEPGVADRIIFKPMYEASQRAIALQNGEIDVCIDPAAADLRFLEDDDNLVVFKRDGSRLFYMGFNVSKPPFDDVVLRRAVSCAIDRNFIVMSLFGGRAKWQTTVLNRGNWSFLDNDEIDGYKFDVERAKKLLQESAYPDGVTADMYISSSDPYRSVAQIIQDNLRKIGVDIKIKVFDDATLKAECAAGNAQCFLWRWNVMGRIDECFRDIFYTD